MNRTWSGLKSSGRDRASWRSSGSPSWRCWRWRTRTLSSSPSPRSPSACPTSRRRTKAPHVPRRQVRLLMIAEIRRTPKVAKSSPRSCRRCRGRTSRAASAAEHGLRLAQGRVAGPVDQPGAEPSLRGVVFDPLIIVVGMFRFEVDYFFFPALSGFLVLGPLIAAGSTRRAGGWNATSARASPR